MTELLTELLEAGLIEMLGGDDTRLEKIEKAAGTVARELRAQPPRLIRAVLAGLDPDVPASDPAIVQAKQALVAEWKSMSSVYTDTPIGLLRAILLEACNLASEEGNNAAILWLTAADSLPLRRLGREEQSVRGMLETCAHRTERSATAVIGVPGAPEHAKSRSLAGSFETGDIAVQKIDRESLRLRVAAAAGPQVQGNTAALNNPNPHWPAANNNWSFEFAPRMSGLLADELETLAQTVQQQQAQLGLRLRELMSEFTKNLEEERHSQNVLLRNTLAAGEHRNQAEKLRLDALWWSEALYSSSVRRSYREMEAPLAAVVMSVDLLTYVPSPSPASVGYLLAETVNRLPGAGFDRNRGVRDLLVELHELRGHLPREWVSAVDAPPAEGRLSLRDAVVKSLQDREWDVDASMRQAGLTSDISLSLPALAHAIFRQEQAVRLSGSGK